MLRKAETAGYILAVAGFALIAAYALSFAFAVPWFESIRPAFFIVGVALLVPGLFISVIQKMH
jgi:hypothetical protein